ncbi:hypothetical protein DM860_009827 [Cuscuta australis]|uniref:Uncharacterized protein n=1 Tax=Cuscuta australis TaxID=267555 RepID=A0A328DBA6_9ASTE|nr:hypothetical protein DM860_009827 [Cuscuta australis]
MFVLGVIFIGELFPIYYCNNMFEYIDSTDGCFVLCLDVLLLSSRAENALTFWENKVSTLRLMVLRYLITLSVKDDFRTMFVLFDHEASCILSTPCNQLMDKSDAVCTLSSN